MLRTEKFANLRASRALLSVCAIAIVGTAGLAVSGCATSKMIANAEQICQDWREISVSKNDTLTQGTAAQIEAGNEVRKTWGCSA